MVISIRNPLEIHFEFLGFRKAQKKITRLKGPDEWSCPYFECKNSKDISGNYSNIIKHLLEIRISPL